jgi:predicted enzyme related to lactoylglutathione lyase
LLEIRSHSANGRASHGEGAKAMSQRHGYQPGVPCWIDTWQADAEGAVAFYARLFGWESEDTMPPNLPGRHFMCRLRGRDVAAVASRPGAAPQDTTWNTYVWVENANQAAAAATTAGGSVVMAPFESLDGGRIAMVADPVGATIGVWQPGEHKGAQLVNEPGAWAMSQLQTPDPEGAKAFYGAVFGWHAEVFGSPEDGIALWRLPGYVGGEPHQPVPRDVVATMGPSGDKPTWMLDFWIHDADAAAATARQLGGAVVATPFDAPPFRSAVLADREGAAFSVSELKVRRSSPRAGSARSPHDA